MDKPDADKPAVVDSPVVEGTLAVRGKQAEEDTQVPAVVGRRLVAGSNQKLGMEVQNLH